MPSLTFLASANMARYVGAEVLFADVDPQTGLLTPDDAAARQSRPVGRRRKRVVPVHVNGQCCDMPAIKRVAATTAWRW